MENSSKIKNHPIYTIGMKHPVIPRLNRMVFGQICPLLVDGGEWVSACGGYLRSFGCAKTACLKKDDDKYYMRERERERERERATFVPSGLNFQKKTAFFCTLFCPLQNSAWDSPNTEKTLQNHTIPRIFCKGPGPHQ
jgi:hypothetical protein